MTTSCINTQLVHQAVAGTNVNSTLLIKAFVHLCPPQPSLTSVIAEHWATILTAYSCGFVPWAFLVLFDFISPKWKSIRRTRWYGYLHLIGAIIPMAVIVAYAFFQGASGDYKEMMTAIAAVVVTMYHLARTIWGLVQLRAFGSWCARAMECIAIVGDDPGVDKARMEREVKVNDEVIDNEFHGRDVSVKFDFRNWRLAVSNPELLTLRWCATILCSPTVIWGRSSLRFCAHPSLDLPSIWYLSHTTLPIPGSFSKSSFLCIRQFLEEWHNEGIGNMAFGAHFKSFTLSCTNWTEDGIVFRKRKEYLGLRNYKPTFGSADVTSETMNNFKFELDSIVSSFPSDKLHDSSNNSEKSNRNNMSLAQVEVLIIVSILGPEVLSSLKKENRRNKFLVSQDTFFDVPEEPWSLLCHQIGAKEEIFNIHPFWEIFLVPLWNQNKYLLQASAHVDIEVALELGTYFDRKRGDDSEHLIYVDVFNKMYDLMRDADVLRKRIDKYSLGCTLDAVRTFLAEWVVSQSTPGFEATWKPAVSLHSVEFIASDFVWNFSYFESECSEETESYIKRRIIWECQSALHHKVACDNSRDWKSPSSECLMMLFICAYPQIVVFWEARERNRVVFEIRPTNRPQCISVEAELSRESGTLVARLNYSEDVTNFEWEAWVNASMGLMKGLDDKWQRDREENTNSKDLRELRGASKYIKPVDLCRPVIKLKPPHEELKNLKGELNVWTGWPMFDVRISQFEMDQFIFEAISGENEDEEPPWRLARRYKEHRGAAEEILTIVADWSKF